ncbi:Uncharacterised protein [Porphyromonas crevioricanis]|uniref:Uncharacterized protein n=1 Tax=Porphyromonas crevioricanis TaxID=393921 RepID=A0A2X4PUP8_9PORP|nr:hypothetical protein SAMN02745203_00613 [Porphyromonas crevioricanis]SQH72279.1 Uncharacterised protein [Porphyromonas crevioricanis]
MDSKKAIKTRLFVDFAECGNLEGIKTKGTENILVAYGQARMLKITYQCHIMPQSQVTLLPLPFQTSILQQKANRISCLLLPLLYPFSPKFGFYKHL